MWCRFVGRCFSRVELFLGAEEGNLRLKVPLILAGVVVSVFGVCLTPVFAQSEATIRGQLVAQADGVPVGQGTVILRSMTTNASAQTSVDAAGRFTFSNLSPGEYVVTASC